VAGVSDAVPSRLWPAALALALAPAAAAASGAAAEGSPSAPAVEPIRFARGASGAGVRGAVVRGERALYSLQARGGQRMSVRIASPERNAVFQVYAPGAAPEVKGSALEVVGRALPGAGEVVGATRGNATYRLDIRIR
jgi:hypothetical protein